MGCTDKLMPVIQMSKSTQSTGMERVHYYPRQLMTVEDMRVEQEYFLKKMRLHNRLLHGWGVVCGMKVSAKPGQGVPWQVSVSEGFGLSPQGDDIYLPAPICLDVAKCGLGAEENPCEPGQPIQQRNTQTQTVYLAIRYTECPTRPVRTQPGGCGCDETGCEYSRIRDDYEISCLLELPETHQTQPNQDLCSYLWQGDTPEFPPCPKDPWVVLAQITLPGKMDTELTDSAINNGIRRLLFSTNLIQRQLESCCCD